MTSPPGANLAGLIAIGFILWFFYRMFAGEAKSMHEIEMENIHREAEKQALREDLGVERKPAPSPSPQTGDKSLKDLAQEPEPTPEPEKPETSDKPEIKDIGSEVDIGVDKTEYRKEQEKTEFTHDDAQSRVGVDETDPPDMDSISELVESVDTDIEDN